MSTTVTGAAILEGQPETLGLYTRTLTLNDNIIKTLPTIGFEVISSPPTDGQIILPLFALIRTKIVAGYSNIDAGARLGLETPDQYGVLNYAYEQQGNILTQTLGTANDNFLLTAMQQPYANYNNNPNYGFQPSSFRNQPVLLKIGEQPSGNLLDGHVDNIVEITVVYSIISIS